MRTLVLACLLFALGCATGASGLMRLQDRELLIHPDKPGLAYPHKVEECKYKSSRFKWLGKKCKKVQKMDFYDFTDKAIRQKLIDSGFSCKSVMRFKY